MIENDINILKKGVICMLINQIDFFREKLENQIIKNEPYDEIYQTSIIIDKLLVDYYKSGQLGKDI